MTPSAPGAGATLTIGYKVTNQGTGSAAGHGLRFYVSSNTSLETASDTNLTPSLNIGSLAAGAATSGTTTRTLPAGLAPGAWHLIAWADGFQAISESNENNNTASSPITVGGSSATLTVTRSGTGSGTVTSSPAGVDCGSRCSAPFTSGAMVTLSAAAASGSTFAGWSGACTGAGTCSVTMSTSRSVTATFSRIPTLPDLVAQVSITPTSVAPGATLTIGSRTSNQGSAMAGLSETRLYLSRDAAFDAGDTYLPAAIPVPSLAPGVAVAGSTPRALPATLAAGTWHIVAVADATAAVNETSETNNAGSAPFTVTGGHALTVTRAGNGSGTVTSSPAGITCGSNCSATFGSGTEVTLTAAAAAGSSFTAWSGACTGTSTECRVTMSAARTVTASFSMLEKPDLISDNLTVSPSSVPVGGQVTIGYKVTNQGQVTASASGLRLYLSTDANLDPASDLNWTPAVNIPALMPGGAVAGTSVRPLPANITPGQYFVIAWADGFEAVVESRETNNTAVAQLTVVPATFTLTVQRGGTGSGAVTSAPAGISCGSACSATFTAGSSVTLTAAAAGGSVFAGWSGACTGPQTSCSVTMSEARAVTATFGPESTPDLSSEVTSISPSTAQPGGTLAIGYRVLNAGSGPAPAHELRLYLSRDEALDTAADMFLSPAVTIAAIDAGKASAAATVNRTLPSSLDNGTWYVIARADSAQAVTEASETNNTSAAAFSVGTPRHTLTVTRAGDGAGGIASSPDGIDCGETCTATFAHDTLVSLTATADVGSRFAGWSGVCTGTSSCIVRMSTALNVAATFTRVEALSLAVTRNGHGTVSSSPSGIDCGTSCSANFAEGSVVILTATPAAGSQFAGWGGDCTGTETCSVTLSSPRAVSANFTTGASRAVTIASVTGTAGGAVEVPVRLNAVGDESALGFSLSWNPAHLTLSSATKGGDASAATLTPNATSVSAGRWGGIVAMPAGGVFTAGQREVLKLTFQIAAESPEAIVVDFGDTPVAKEVVDGTASVLQTAWTAGTISLATGIESDVTAETGKVSAADGVKVCRFAAGLDTPMIGSEFQRADTSPRDTRGDGKLTTGDCVQAMRDAAGLDDRRSAGGPTAPVADVAERTIAAAGPPRQVRLLGGSIAAGGLGLVPVRLAAAGTENAVGFSVEFDPEVLTFVTASPGGALPAPSVIVNEQASGAGRIGVLVSLPAGQQWGAGSQDVVVLAFRMAAGASGSTPVVFGDSPVALEVVSVDAQPLAAEFLGTSLSIVGSQAIVVAPSALRFHATKASRESALGAVTPAQKVDLRISGLGMPRWSISASQPWIQVEPKNGVGSAELTVSIADPANALQDSVDVSALVSVALTDIEQKADLPVRLVIALGATTKLPPIGQVETPAQGATGVVGAIGVTGWVIDDIGVRKVDVFRDCVPAEPQVNCQDGVVPGAKVVFLGEAVIVKGARPDVEAAFPTYPAGNLAGWGLAVLTNMLPRTTGTYAAFGGQGPITFYALAEDVDGNRTLLGRAYTGDNTPTSITMDNDNIAKPFGTIDTPGQGATVSGTVPNFGWALTPDSNTTADGSDILIPTNGSTSFVFINGSPVAPVNYNQCRGSVGNPVPGGAYCNDDVSNIFGNPTPQASGTARLTNPTRYRNLDAARGPIGSYVIDTATLGNGLHTIAWSVTDSANRTEGLGSRFFNVLNSGARPAPAASRGPASMLDAMAVSGEAIVGRAGFDLSTPYEIVGRGESGVASVVLPASGRLELRVGPVSAGYLVANGELRALPPGSQLDAASGTFTWAPGPGFLGTYRLVFVGTGEQVPVDVTLRDTPQAATASEIRMHLDSPSGNSASRGPVTVAGWALDPQAWTSSGIAAVHAWARRIDMPGMPEFVGVAELGGARPDVAAVHGAQFGAAGFSLTATLGEGTWEVTVFAWNARTRRFEDARSGLVTVR